MAQGKASRQLSVVLRIGDVKICYLCIGLATQFAGQEQIPLLDTLSKMATSCEGEKSGGRDLVCI